MMTPRSSCPGGERQSSPGRSKAPVLGEINTLTQTRVRVDRMTGMLNGPTASIRRAGAGLSRNYAARLEDASDEPIDMVEIAVSGLA